MRSATQNVFHEDLKRRGKEGKGVVGGGVTLYEKQVASPDLEQIDQRHNPPTEARV